MGPVSTITETLEKNAGINNEVIKGKNLENSGVYKRFFDYQNLNKIRTFSAFSCKSMRKSHEKVRILFFTAERLMISNYHCYFFIWD